MVYEKEESYYRFPVKKGHDVAFRRVFCRDMLLNRYSHARSRDFYIEVASTKRLIAENSK
jgi:hypothetical protein